MEKFRLILISINIKLCFIKNHQSFQISTRRTIDREVPQTNNKHIINKYVFIIQWFKNALFLIELREPEL